MKVNFWSYLPEFHREKAEIMAAVERVFESGRLILGEQVERFEAEFAAYCGVSHGIGVNSATDGLTLALLALGVGPGDEVITVANTAVPTVSAIASTGARPVFVDIDPATFLMDVSLVEAAITPRTRCLLPVHLFGQCVDMAPLTAVARRHGLRILEDCSQSHGARYHGRPCGSLGDLAVFSFYPTKVLGAYGDAGLVVTDDADLAAQLRRLRYYGMEKQYFALEHGYNSRLDEVQAAILRVKLTHLDTYIARRRILAKQYDEQLAALPLRLPAVMPHREHVYYQYVCRHPQRNQLMERLAAQMVGLNIVYPWPIHTMPGYAYLGYLPGHLPHTEQAAQEIFSLPLYPDLLPEAQAYVIDCLVDFFK
jgi:dTDP-3-amino-2,3,6-trideoxy-4-keto-D-glucose/dTDP-3-amino-3,4,6-trideoxy-alpha-D-glucose/dTDP-2,6-dideoxy-D-kanosamine transaminase